MILSYILYNMYSMCACVSVPADPTATNHQTISPSSPPNGGVGSATLFASVRARPGAPGCGLSSARRGHLKAFWWVPSAVLGWNNPKFNDKSCAMGGSRSNAFGRKKGGSLDVGGKIHALMGVLTSFQVSVNSHVVV